MELREEELEEEQLRGLPTRALIGRAVDEARLLIKAELLVARRELEDELRSFKRAAVLLAGAALASLLTVALLFVALAWVIPLARPLGALIVAAGLLGGGVLLVLLGKRLLPLKPMAGSRARLLEDFRIAKERLQ
jgi:hypothetical protein